MSSIYVFLEYFSPYAHGLVKVLKFLSQIEIQYENKVIAINCKLEMFHNLSSDVSYIWTGTAKFLLENRVMII